MLATLPSNFTWIDWAIVAACLAVTTWFGHALAGKQSTLRDFWLGGRKLPWYAVSASIVATQLSGTTFIVLPMLVFTSDFRYIQLALFGQLIARFVVGFVILPQYYKRDIYSPYEYMADRLGPGVRKMTTAIYVATTVLSMGARIYTAALLLELIMQGPLSSFTAATGVRPIVAAMWLIGLVSMAWTLMGGINTVVWTDLFLFAFFFLGAIVALVCILSRLPGGVSEMAAVAGAAGKFRLIDFDTSPVARFTVWTAVIGASIDGIGGLGTNQTVTQRLLCCKNAVHARWALISSWLGIAVPLTCMTVGAALFAYYQRFPLDPEAKAFVAAGPNRVFPHFILTVLPTGLCGLIAAAILAAALASLESVQAALAQISVSNVYAPARKSWLRRRGVPVGLHEDKLTLRVSRVMIVVWSVVLCLAAVGVERFVTTYPSLSPTLIDFMGQIAAYFGGALLGGFLLAFLPLNIDGRGYMYAAPLSLIAIFAVVMHDPWAQGLTAATGGALLALWLLNLARAGPAAFTSRPLVGTVLLFAAVLASVALSRWGYWTDPARPGVKLVLAWPWYVMVGTAITVAFGWLLARPATISTAISAAADVLPALPVPDHLEPAPLLTPSSTGAPR